MRLGPYISNYHDDTVTPLLPAELEMPSYICHWHMSPSSQPEWRTKHESIAWLPGPPGGKRPPQIPWYFGRFIRGRAGAALGPPPGEPQLLGASSWKPRRRLAFDAHAASMSRRVPEPCAPPALAANPHKSGHTGSSFKLATVTTGTSR